MYSSYNPYLSEPDIYASAAYILNAIMLIYGFIFVLVVVNYLLKGFGMFGIAKKTNVPNRWLAFIPIVSNYLQGELAGEIKIGSKKMKKPGVWMLLTPIVVVFLYIVWVLYFVISVESNFTGNSALLSAILYFIIVLGVIFNYTINALIRFHIHKKYVDDSKALIHTILGIFIPLYQSIYFFILRKRDVVTVEEFETAKPNVIEVFINTNADMKTDEINVDSEEAETVKQDDQENQEDQEDAATEQDIINQHILEDDLTEEDLPHNEE